MPRQKYSTKTHSPDYKFKSIKNTEQKKKKKMNVQTNEIK